MQLRLDLKADQEKVGSSIRYQFHLHMQSHMEEIAHTMDQFIAWGENENNPPGMRKEAMRMSHHFQRIWFLMKEYWCGYEPINHKGECYKHLIEHPDDFLTRRAEEAARDRERVRSVKEGLWLKTQPQD